MTIAWNNRSPSYFNREDAEATFQRHNELMKKFRLSHPRVETIDSKNARTADWQTLVPIQQVKPAMCSPN